MKKILLATTMLASVAGYAAADVAVSGDARMGVVSSDNATTFSSRVRVKFTGSGTTDSNLSYGGSFRAADANGANAGASGSVFISGAFGKITMGDVDSGDAAAVGQLASVGYTGLGSTNSINYAADGFDLFGLPAMVKASVGDPESVWGYSSNQTAGAIYAADTSVDAGASSKVLYTYSAGGLTVDASASQISNDGSHSAYGLGVAYTTGGLTLAAGYGSNEWDFTTTANATLWVGVDGEYAVVSDYSDTVAEYDVSGDVTDSTVAATYVMGDTTLKAIYQDKEVSGVVDGEDAVSATATSMGLSVQHTMGALTLTAFGVTTDLSSNITSDSEKESVSFTRTGIGASYDLGGGASLAAGVVNVEAPYLDAGIGYYAPPYATLETSSYTAYDVGVNFSF